MNARFTNALVLLSVLVATAGAAYAHGGGLDTDGCHHDRMNGGYHCHQGPLAGQSFASQSEMLAVLEAKNQETTPMPERV